MHKLPSPQESQVTAQHLIMIHREIESWKNSGSVLYQWNQPKIKAFYGHNEIRLKSIDDRMTELGKKYCLTDDNGIIKMQEGTQIPQMKFGLKVEDYNKEFAELLNQLISTTI